MSPKRKAPPRPTWAQREAERVAESEGYLSQTFRFLVTDYDYVDIGAIPVRTPEVDVHGYRNAAARLQVEVCGHRGATFTGLIRRLIDGVPAPYTDTDQLLELHEIATIRRPHVELSHNMVGWRGAVDNAARVLRANPDLLTGEGWISRAKIRRAWFRDSWFLAPFSPRRWLRGALLGESDPGSPLDDVRSAFAFLLDLGYEIAVDTDLLTPHEYLVPRELRYERGAHSVAIRNVDFRDQEWAIEHDGRQVGTHFHASPKELAARAAMVRKELSGGTWPNSV